MALAEQLIQRGREEGMQSVVLASLKKGLSIKDIVDITGLNEK